MKIEIQTVSTLKIDYALFRIAPEMEMTLKVRFNVQPTTDGVTPIAIRYFATYFSANNKPDTEPCEFVVGIVAMVHGYQDGMFDLVRPELIKASYPTFIKRMNEIAFVIGSSGTVFNLPDVNEAMKL